MTRTALSRLVASGGVLAAAVIGTAAPAAAREAPAPVPVLGPAAIAPVTGDLETPPTVTTAGGCPKGTNIVTQLYGKGFPPGGANVVGNVPTTDYGSPPAARMAIPFAITIKEAGRTVQAPYKPFTPVGDYQVVVTCQDPLPDASGRWTHGRFVGTIRIGTNGRYTALTTAASLPNPPRPAPGPLPSQAPVAATPTPTPLPSTNPARAAPEAQQPESQSQQSDDGGSGSRTLIVSLGVLLAGAAVVYWVVSRLPVRTAARPAKDGSRPRPDAEPAKPGSRPRPDPKGSKTARQKAGR